ncbi:serine/threonine-protein kinase [Verrucosispora sp. WMMA2121]|uniref:serine/threonine-protein kinase n=1 Tax=Verrucosispora sp. WMMA2121 TaxID=3015164 RepID=UPI0022B64984|nr:serine/threonine-protein kinase [Verrucosispora sp. WMMA2121]MCZ7420939.1 serine/threonine-protein kinase [Verrucosispora sp. WMMA2121]
MTQIPTWSGGPVSTPTNGRATPGTVIGDRYSLRSAVGNGGMGTVWRATDTLLRRDVAVKEVVLPPGLAPSDRDAMYERTLREARAAAAIAHPAVVQVYDVVTEAGRPWIVMELLDARSLADMVIEDGPIAQRVVAKIGIALLGALEVAHAIGVLHRDVKPANVLICSDGRCVLTDFGVARMPTDVQLTTPGMVLGSPHFISPERAMGQEFGPPSDLFSLGVTLYTAVEGRPPFDRGDPIETMHAVVEDPPAPPQRSGPLTRVLMGLLEKVPARRLDVHTARAMLRELLAGPLSSSAAGVNSMTDQYSVMPVPQPAPISAPAAPAKPTPSGQIGGRAMLGPGESLTDRLAALRRGERPGQAAAAGAAAMEETSADALARPAQRGTAMSPPAGRTYGGADATQRIGSDSTQRVGPEVFGYGGQPDATQRIGGYGAAPDATQQLGGYGAQPEATQRVGGYGPQPDATQQVGAYGAAQWPAAPHQPYGAPAAAGGGSSPVDRAKAAGTRVVDTVQGWPRKVQLAAAGGLAVLLLIGIVAFASGGDETPTTPVAEPSTSADEGPGIEMQEHSARGVQMLVPKGWKRAAPAGGVYIDYTDPEDSGRRVRILNEKWSGTSVRWAQVAENGLKTRSASCAKPYTQVAMAEKELAGKPSAEFEYTCGEGAEMRHGIWHGVAHDGRLYSFYLTSTDARFEESKPIYAAMLKSFQLTAAG